MQNCAGGGRREIYLLGNCARRHRRGVGKRIGTAEVGAGTFDGKYVGVSIRCFPNAIALPSISFYVVSGNSFSHQFNFNGETRRCTLSIGADGAFSNKDCGVPTSGKVVGDRLDVEFKAPESICNVVLKRER